jgi:hypothetical protein
MSIKDPAAKFTKREDALRLTDVQFGAVLQWIEDGLPDHCFVVRDYGLVLMKRGAVPPGALLLDDFRKEAAKAKEVKK